jgi:hypothetical protein
MPNYECSTSIHIMISTLTGTDDVLASLTDLIGSKLKRLEKPSFVGNNELGLSLAHRPDEDQGSALADFLFSNRSLRITIHT